MKQFCWSMFLVSSTKLQKSSQAQCTYSKGSMNMNTYIDIYIYICTLFVGGGGGGLPHGWHDSIHWLRLSKESLKCKIVQVSDTVPMDVASTEQGDCLNGVSSFHLRTDFVDQILESGCTRNDSFYVIEPVVIRARSRNVLCPRTQKMGSSYVDSLTGAEHVGRSDYMLSYSWGYEVGDVVAALSNHCDSEHHDHKGAWTEFRIRVVFDADMLWPHGTRVIEAHIIGSAACASISIAWWRQAACPQP